MIDKERLENTLALTKILQEEMQQSFPPILMGLDHFFSNTNNYHIHNYRKKAEHILSSSIIVYLFSLWDTYITHETVDRYLKDDEKERFFAFKHIRIVAAHNIEGDRTGNKPGSGRMGHADKLDRIMNSDKPISGVTITSDAIKLSVPDPVLDCRQFMQDLSISLPARYWVGGPSGKIRGPNGTEADMI